MAGQTNRFEYLARLADGEHLVSSIDALDECLTKAVETRLAEFWLVPATPAKQLGSLALRIFGLKPRPAVVLHLGAKGALVTFRDRNGGDYRAVNREFEGQATRSDFVMHDGRRITHRADEALELEPAFELVREFFRQGDRPWRIACRPVVL